jgi:transcriptional regulator with XRE-family HTH domain
MLRRLRQQAGKTLDEAAKALEVSAATISRYETGHRLPRGRDVRDLCALYGLAPGPEMDRLLSIAAHAREQGWWESYSEVEGDAYSTWIGLEAAATSIEVYQAATVPGILQTPDYARSLLSRASFRASGRPYTKSEIEHHVEIRQRRQRVLRDRSIPIRVVLDEAVVARTVGSVDIMREQLDRLADMSEEGRIDARVLAFHAGAHGGALGSFMILGVDSEVVSDVVYVHSMGGEVTLDDPADVERCRTTFASLHKLALGSVASIGLLRKHAPTPVTGT